MFHRVYPGRKLLKGRICGTDFPVDPTPEISYESQDYVNA
jgi:hypothetical protein